MNITKEHIKTRKRIGTLDNRPVVQLTTSGGLYIVASPKGNELEFLGVGSHRAVARYMAKKRNPSIKLTELTKSDYVDEQAILSVYPKYEQLLNDLNEVANG